MPDRCELIQEWREKAIARDAFPGRRRHWIFWTSGRVCRILLSLYGRGQWRSAVESRIPSPAPLDAAALDAVPLHAVPRTDINELEGRPPKSTSAVRSVLKKVHTAVPLAAPGRFTHGLGSGESMLAFSSRSKQAAAFLRRDLARLGIRNKTAARRSEFQVWVPLELWAKAADRIECLRRTHAFDPFMQRYRRRRRWLAGLLAVPLAAALSALALAAIASLTN